MIDKISNDLKIAIEADLLSKDIISRLLQLARENPENTIHVFMSALDKEQAEQDKNDLMIGLLKYYIQLGNKQ